MVKPIATAHGFKPCLTCRGSGTVQDYAFSAWKFWRIILCPDCNGSGGIITIEHWYPAPRQMMVGCGQWMTSDMRASNE